MADVARINPGAIAAPASSGTAQGVSGAVSGAIEISADKDLVIVTPRGFYTDMEEHFADLDRVLKQQRLRYPVLRGLVDLRETAVQSGTVLADIKTRSHQTWGPRDRVAITVSGVLVKRQTSRLAEDSNFRLFDSIDEAREWLGIS